MTTEQENRVDVGPWRMRSLTIQATPPAGSEPPTVVLVHGLGMSSRSLLPTARLLARTHRVVLPDLPGNGGSTRPAEPLDVPGLADALLQWLDVTGLRHVPLVGHSLGCQVAVHAAGRDPERVDCLVLVSPSRDPRIATPWRKALRLLLDGPREKPGLMVVAVTDYLRAGPLRMWRTLKAALETDPVRSLGAVRQPTLVVRGDRDLLVSAWWARTITQLVRDGRTATLAGGPHGLPFSRPDELTATIAPFLTAHRRTTRPG